MPIDALDRALRTVGKRLDDPTSDVDRSAGYRDLAWHVSTLHLAERAVLTEPDLPVKSTVLALLLELRSPTQHRDLLERAGMADDTFLVGRSRDLTRLRELAIEPSSLRPEDIDSTSRWFQEQLVVLPRQVGQSRDRRDLSNGRVGSVVVVVVEPSWQSASACFF